MNIRSLALSTVFLLAVACGGNATPNDPAPLVTLPEDEGPHDSGIEWWYFNGLLTDDRGQEYSYHYVTFQSEATGAAVPHLLQASLGDHTAGKHLTGEQVFLDSLDPDATGIDVAVNGWAMRGDGQSYNLTFDLGGYFLNLKAVSVRPPVLHQGIGLVSLGSVGDLYYYSRTRLDVTGTLAVAGEQRTVTGTRYCQLPGVIAIAPASVNPGYSVASRIAVSTSWPLWNSGARAWRLYPRSSSETSAVRTPVVVTI